MRPSSARFCTSSLPKLRPLQSEQRPAQSNPHGRGTCRRRAISLRAHPGGTEFGFRAPFASSFCVSSQRSRQGRSSRRKGRPRPFLRRPWGARPGPKRPRPGRTPPPTPQEQPAPTGRLAMRIVRRCGARKPFGLPLLRLSETCRHRAHRARRPLPQRHRSSRLLGRYFCCWCW